MLMENISILFEAYFAILEIAITEWAKMFHN